MKYCQTVLLLTAMLRSSTMALSSTGWTDVAIKAANGLADSQREKLKTAGALDIQRPVNNPSRESE